MGDPMSYHYDEDGRDRHSVIEVVEVPGCQFNGFLICLSTRNREDLHRLKIAAARFNKWFNEQARGGIIMPSSIGRPIVLH